MSRRVALAATCWAWVCAATANENATLALQSSRAVNESDQRLLVLPTVNGEPRGVALLLLDAEGSYYVTTETLAEWRLAPPYPPPRDVDGTQFHSLAALPGLGIAVVQRDLTATVTVPPALMLGSRRSLVRQGDEPAPAGAFGAYLDYELFYSDDGLSAERGLTALLSPTLFTRHGSLSASALYRGGAAPATHAPNSWVRLETAWRRDDPDRMRTLRIGDAITPYGSWARSVRVGGIQIGTNFATRPQLVTFPQPSISGTAAVPTAVDILVNGSLRSHTQVPSGAFTIDDVPVVTGAGQIQVVTRDLLGREQVVTQDFYVSERLLRRGLNEYSVTAGALREDFGLASNAYGDFVIAGVLRRGLSDLLTIEGRIEGTSTVQMAGVSIARAVGRHGVTSVALAASDGRAQGALWQVGHEYRGRVYRAGLRAQGSRDFAQPGLDAPAAWPKLQVVASGGRNLRGKGSVGFSYVSERFGGRAGDRRALAVSHSRSLPRNLALATSVGYTRAGDGVEAAVSVSVSRVLGPRRSASASLQARHRDVTVRVDHRHEPPVGPGFGYRASAVSGPRAAADAELTVNTAHARYSAELSRRNGGSGWRLQTRGSLALLGGGIFASREISDGFAVVDADGYAGVRVYLENREIGTTNARGYLLVPRLRPYESNRLRIAPADLPLTARIDDPALRIAPYYRSGAIAKFAIEAGASAIVRAVTPHGNPVPEGARARVGAGEFQFPVGMDGRLYVQNVGAGAQVEVMYNSSRCAFTVAGLSAHSDAVTDLGVVVCAPLEDARESREPP